MGDYFIHLQVKCVAHWPFMCQKYVNICTEFMFLDQEFKSFLLFWTFMSIFSWCLGISGALNCVSGYVNWPFDTSVCGQMATVGHHSRMISDLECGWAVLQRRPAAFALSSLFIWSLFSILSEAHLLAGLAGSVKSGVRHGASNLRYFNIQLG